MDQDLVRWRRYLHQNPEIGYDTYNTAKYLYNELEKLGYKPTYLLKKTAVLVELNLNKPKTIAFRSDMDALKIKEETNLEFKSNNDYMHACGHDGHMTIMLMLAKMIISNQDKLNYNVIIFFQPAEEGPLPGGAFYLKENETLRKADMFFAYHVSPTLEVGEIGLKYEEACAAPDLWELEITGTGCHASTPEKGASPILAANYIVSKFNDLHNSLKNKHIVISTTYFHSGVSMNIIPNKAYLKGTARSFSLEMRNHLATSMQKIISSAEVLYNVEAKFDFHYAYPPLYNDINLCNMVKEAAKNVIKEENIKILNEPAMIGEDFAYYKEIAPICLTWLGTKEKDAPFYDLHNSKFKVNEESLEIGANILFNILVK